MDCTFSKEERCEILREFFYRVVKRIQASTPPLLIAIEAGDFLASVKYY